jgi:putative FmdB family regulatory protein
VASSKWYIGILINMSNFFDSSIERTYECLSCKHKFCVVQKLKDKWKKRCPSCKKHELVITDSNTNVQTMVDVNKPKTLGCLADKNRDRKEKLGETTEGMRKKPFWRKDYKINYNILKDPNKYVKKGYV